MSLRILFVAPRLPWPLDTGGKIRTYHLLRALARQHQITLFTFREGGSAATAQAEALEQLQKLDLQLELFDRPGPVGKAIRAALGLTGPLPYNVASYLTARMVHRARQLLRRGSIDLVHCDHLHMAPVGLLSGARYIVDQHNIESQIWQRYAEDQRQPLHRKLVFRHQGRHLRLAERALCLQSSLLLLCSDADRRTLWDLMGHQKQPDTLVIPNGVALETFSSVEDGGAQGGHIFFSGSMDWPPNEDAALHFLRSIWPEVRRRFPDQQFRVVGRNPGPSLRRHHGQRGVAITGTVPDVRPHMRGALALVVPIQVGGGTRLKILEAFAAHIPVISTSLGIEGIEARPEQHYLLAESPADFTQAIGRLRQDPDLAARLSHAAFDLASSKYSWNTLGEQLAQEYALRFSQLGEQAWEKDLL